MGGGERPALTCQPAPCPPHLWACSSHTQGSHVSLSLYAPHFLLTTVTSPHISVTFPPLSCPATTPAAIASHSTASGLVPLPILHASKLRLAPSEHSPCLGPFPSISLLHT